MKNENWYDELYDIEAHRIVDNALTLTLLLPLERGLP